MLEQITILCSAGRNGELEPLRRIDMRMGDVAAIIGGTPIVLLDAVKNAGIHRTRAIEMLRRYRNIFIIQAADGRSFAAAAGRAVAPRPAASNC